MIEQLIQYAYLGGAVLLILGMRALGSPKTAVRGNLIASGGAITSTTLATRSPPPAART